MPKKPTKRTTPPAAAERPTPPVPRRLPPAPSKSLTARLNADDVTSTDGKRTLSKRQVDAIRQLALAMAGPELPSDAVLICNPITETPALPLSEILYDRCRWCETDIYYDRLMPSPPGLMRVCLKCGIMLLEAEKKGAN